MNLDEIFSNLNSKFATKEDRQAAIFNYQSLLAHPGWKLFIAGLEANIAFVQNQINEGVEDETLEVVRLLRRLKKQMEEMRDTPQAQIKLLQEMPEEEINLDPYETVQDVQKRRHEQEEKDKEEKPEVPS